MRYVVKLKKPEDINEHYNDSFKEFVRNNQGKSFVVIREDENSVLLKNMYFWITKDNLLDVLPKDKET